MAKIQKLKVEVQTLECRLPVKNQRQAEELALEIKKVVAKAWRKVTAFPREASLPEDFEVMNFNIVGIIEGKDGAEDMELDLNSIDGKIRERKHTELEPTNEDPTVGIIGETEHINIEVENPPTLLKQLEDSVEAEKAKKATKKKNK